MGLNYNGDCATLTDFPSWLRTLTWSSYGLLLQMAKCSSGRKNFGLTDVWGSKPQGVNRTYDLREGLGFSKGEGKTPPTYF
jgi:hypothetical protein